MNIGKVSNALALGQALLAGFAVVGQLVTQVETAVTDAGVTIPGAEKLALLKVKLTAYLTATGHAVEVVSNALPALVATVNAYVAAFHLAGLFKHASGITPPPHA